MNACPQTVPSGDGSRQFTTSFASNVRRCADILVIGSARLFIHGQRLSRSVSTSAFDAPGVLLTCCELDFGSVQSSELLQAGWLALKKENHALRLRMLRRQKPLDDFAHACFYFCAQGTCLAPIHWTSGADRRRVARCGFMSSFGSLYCRSLTWYLALLISRQSLMCGGPRRSRVFSRNERAMQNQRGRCGI
jgi:hypothetical protein